MSISLYYTANRDSKLTSSEISIIDSIIAEYDIDENEIVCDKSESLAFYPYDSNEDGIVLKGSVKLPNNQRIIMKYLCRWLELLTDVRNKLSNLEWNVSVDDHVIVWDSKMNAYDPNK